MVPNAKDEKEFWLFFECVAEGETTQCRCLEKIRVKGCEETRNGVGLEIELDSLEGSK